MSKKHFAALAAGASVLLAAVWYFYKPLYYRLYPFDRIRGTVSVSVDGRKAEISPAEGVSTSDGTAHVSIKAGEYGGYSFNLYADGISRPVEVSVYHYNWWNVTRFQLECAADTQSETIDISCRYTMLSEEGTELPESFSKTVVYGNERIYIYIG